MSGIHQISNYIGNYSVVDEVTFMKMLQLENQKEKVQGLIKLLQCKDTSNVRLVNLHELKQILVYT